ncbi:MAG TPA: hypothetical protein VGO57_18175 [Verrucomicrobiae bacterium]|jgi:hypothetical protein
MKFRLCNPFCILGLVVLWRVLLLAFTAQPIPANDAFFFDGAVVNQILHGHYFNPSLAEAFPISGHQVYSAYPPLYQGAMMLWMLVFGASVISAMALHVTLLTLAAFLTLRIVTNFFPATVNYAIVPLLFFGITFSDRPEDLAHVFGLTSLWLLARTISGKENRFALVFITITLLCALYTSIIVGALYFGTGFLVAALAWLARLKGSIEPRLHLAVLAPFIATAMLFALITGIIIKFEPLLWHGFLENARQTSVVTSGVHLPTRESLLKLIRTLPVFLLALVAFPFIFTRRKQLAIEPWLILLTGVLMMGVLMLIVAITVLAPDYVNYANYLQVIVAAGLLALAPKLFSAGQCWPRGLILACTLMMSVRAVGMTTWGVACAWKNSYARTHETLRTELKPFANSPAPVVISSAFLYSALEFGVQRPIHSDWYYDRAVGTNGSGFAALTTLRPPKIILTQFDYYRGFTEVLDRLQHHPELVVVRVRDEAAVRPPESIPKMQRVVQHVSWAPVIVDLDWKN